MGDFGFIFETDDAIIITFRGSDERDFIAEDDEFMEEGAGRVNAICVN